MVDTHNKCRELGRVLFIGGNPRQFPSVQIRCEDIASRLGCDRVFSAKKAKEIPREYSVFVCVKANFNQDEILKLSRRGIVIWDVVDNAPPKQGVSIYLTSTEKARQVFKDYGRVEMIPHHHCNFSGIPNSQECRRPGWIGTLHWYPKLEDIEHDFYDVRRMTVNDVISAHRRIGVGLNIRAKGLRKYAHHMEINSGIKLINCIGFGIPSISNDEPAYHEIGEDCTLFTDLEHCADKVYQLQTDSQLYRAMRDNCLHKASSFHISSIVCKYKALIKSL
jgi:hypothetical protein